MALTSSKDMNSHILDREARSSVLNRPTKFRQSVDQPINLDYEWQKNQRRVFHKIETIQHPVPPDSKLLYHNQNFPVEGLSKPVEYFAIDGNVEIFVQAAVNKLPLKKGSIAVGGMGNEKSNEIVMKIVRVAAANHVANIYTGVDGILSRPALSYLTKKQHCWGFLVHNCRKMMPDYDDEILCIDLIDPNGGPAGSQLMDDIILASQLIITYSIVPTIAFGNRIANCKMITLADSSNLTIFVVDTVSKYAELLKTIFDFDDIHGLVSGAKYFRPFRISIDCNGGAGGVYAKRIFEVELGAGNSVLNHRPSDRPKPLHPSKVGSLPIESEMKSSTTDFGASLDTDGSRVILYGQRGFQIPTGESLAIITAHYQAIPYFQKLPFNGVSRAHGTTSAVEDVLQKLPLMLKRSSGNWMCFNNLMNKECVLACEDEYFGTGSNHVGCSDGIWTILAWLTMVIHQHKPVMNIVTDHWMAHGRAFLTVYEYHDVPKIILYKIMNNLQCKIFPAGNFLCSTHTFDSMSYKIIGAGLVTDHGGSFKDFGYEEPILRVKVKPRGTVLFKTLILGDTGTFRTTVEVHSKEGPHTVGKRKVTESLFKLATAISRIDVITGKSTPDLIY